MTYRPRDPTSRGCRKFEGRRLCLNNGKTRSSLLGIVGAYLIYIAYELWQDLGNTETTMTTPARIVFMALFVLCGAALLVYAVIVWRRAEDQKEEDEKPPEDENSLK